MKNYKIVLFICIFMLGQNVFCAQQASQVLSTSLPQVLEIEEIIVEAVRYQRDEPMTNMNVKEKSASGSNDIILRLSPLRVKIHTNSSNPIIVNAEFKELKHKDGVYDFNPSNLAISPSSYTISDPYDHIITDVFTPFIDVKPDTVIGRYRGSILFTLGSI